MCSIRLSMHSSILTFISSLAILKSLIIHLLHFVPLFLRLLPDVQDHLILTTSPRDTKTNEAKPPPPPQYRVLAIIWHDQYLPLTNSHCHLSQMWSGS